MTQSNQDWYIFKKGAKPHNDIKTRLPKPPRWRTFEGEVPGAEPADKSGEAAISPRQQARKERGMTFEAGDREVEMVNAALYLRRPLLVTGRPGTGKSSLAYAVQYQLQLDEVLYWPITTRSTLQDGLYSYDAIGRLQDTEMGRKGGNGPSETCDPPDIGKYITLGPLGTALLPIQKTRVLLIDEIDKSDIDLPNDLLNVFEEGGFPIPELKRLKDHRKSVSVMTCDDRVAEIENGEVLCHAFPFILLTSNGERELPAPFLRRCLRLDIKPPDADKLARIVDTHFGEAHTDKTRDQRERLVKQFMKAVDEEGRLLSTDQLLNAVFLANGGIEVADVETLRDAVLRDLSERERF
jgi:MoxR-like ATPase